jgi:prepilin-type processing-associated H-X9-DG protein
MQANTSEDPSNFPSDNNPPSFTGRHTNITLGMINQNSVGAVSGGTPCAFLDGHVEMWPAYAVIQALNMGSNSSPCWASPNLQNGGWNQTTGNGKTVYTLQYAFLPG